MAKPPPAPVTLPPPTVAECWWTFVKWVGGVPLLAGGAVGLIWLAYWATGSAGMIWQAESEIGTVLFWIAVISLFYPVMLWVWWGELREGLKRAREWEAMTPEARGAAIAEAAALVAKPKRRARKKG
jgi:hypothetical protein